MTTCPMCDTIRVVCIDDKVPFDKVWHMNCDCGWAWANSSYALTKRDCKEVWERQMALRDQFAARTSPLLRDPEDEKGENENV